jgi:hypothetical protein
MGKARTEPRTGDWRHFTLSVSVFVSIVGTLVLGAWLQAGPDRGTAPAPSAPAPAPPAAAEPLAAVPQELVPPDPAPPFGGDSDLVDRAVRDERRLGASGDGYTLQFAVVCESDNVRSSLRELEGESSFYLLTMLYRDRACFRLCWGFYDTQSQARAERRFPEALRRVTATPKVVSIEDALP